MCIWSAISQIKKALTQWKYLLLLLFIYYWLLPHITRDHICKRFRIIENSNCRQSHPHPVGIQPVTVHSAWQPAQNNCLDWGLQSCVKFERNEQISSAAGPALKLWLVQFGPHVDCGSRAGPVNGITVRTQSNIWIELCFAIMRGSAKGWRPMCSTLCVYWSDSLLYVQVPLYKKVLGP